MTSVVGRFAPSPSGDLHFGSLVSAVGSFLEAKSAGGIWLIRIEDIDPPREISGSAQRIIENLESLGMTADGPVLYQSTRLGAYQQALDSLLKNRLAYPCSCSRKDLPPSGIYPGTCRNGLKKGKQARSVRFLATNQPNAFDDQIQGTVASDTDDFIILRADGLFAYQLAVVVDDHFQGITQVVRGADLLDSTGRQIALQNALGFTTPTYMHLPLVLGANGKKLSKRESSDPIVDIHPARVVTRALRFLGQSPPDNLSLDTLWAWAMENWEPGLIPPEKAYLPPWSS